VNIPVTHMQASTRRRSHSNVRMYVRMLTHTHHTHTTHAYTHAHTHTHTHTNTHTCARTHTCTHVRTHAHTNARTHAVVCTGHSGLFGEHVALMGWLRSVGALKLQVSFAKEPYKRDYILQKRPMILRSLLIEATP